MITYELNKHEASEVISAWLTYARKNFHAYLQIDKWFSEQYSTEQVFATVRDNQQGDGRFFALAETQCDLVEWKLKCL